MNTFLLYLIFVVLPNVGFTLGLFSVVITCYLIFRVINYDSGDWYDENEKQRLLSRIKTISKIVCVLWVIVCLVPSDKQVAFLVGSSYISSIEGTEKLPDNVVKFLNKYMEDTLEEEENK